MGRGSGLDDKNLNINYDKIDYMATPLNLYATKVFAEQPLGLWALDEKADYISLVSQNDRDFANWSSTGVDSVVDATDENVFTIAPPLVPLRDAPASGIISSLNNNGLVTFTSPQQYQPANFSTEIKTFAISTYVYSYSKIIDLRLGYRYVNPMNLQTYEVIKAATTSTTLSWAAVSESFELPNAFQDLELVVEVYYEYDGSNYEFVLNGFTAGQWAEEFCLTSFGQNLINLPTNISGLSSNTGLEAFSYGFSANNGYYLSNDNRLVANNSSLPLVYGSKNSTFLTYNPNDPSLIIPGLGFMNAAGSRNSMTAEFWIQIKTQATEARKIFGPLVSDDGLYVEGPFLKIKVGNVVGSHYVREWDRPMLIDIRISKQKATLILNGEIVIDETIENTNYSFPSNKDSDGNEQDWLGFFCHSDVPQIMLDCVAIYSYEVSAIVAKRRWVFGQGVQDPVGIKGIDSASAITIDYPFAKYPKNYNFPSYSGWASGITENLAIEEDALQMKDHPLPRIAISNGLESVWLPTLESANQDISDPFIAIRPDLYDQSNDVANPLWGAAEGYLYFENMNFLSEQVKAFYGIFETSSQATGKETLFVITNRINSNYLEIYLKTDEYENPRDGSPIFETTIYYSFFVKQPDGGMIENVFYKARGQRVGDRFLVGIDIPRFVKDRGSELATFFGTRQKLKMYIGGSPSFSSTFKGKIRRVSFCNSRNLTKIQHFFTSYGVPVDYENVFNSFGPEVYDAGSQYFFNDPGYWALTLDGGDPYDFVTIGTEEHTATYNLIPKKELGVFFLGIDCNSYWEDYIPLSYLSTQLDDGLGNSKETISQIQVNLDYPRMDNFDGNSYNTNGNLVKSYVSFQYLENGSNKLESLFTNRVPLDKSRVVRPDDNWINTLYEVVDETIVYLPPGIKSENLSINVHLDINIESIKTNNFKLRSLQLAAQAFNDSPKSIGTKFGNNIIPFSKSGDYINYRNVPPIAVYKSSSPYLYRSSNRGIQAFGEYSNSNRKGFSIPINSPRSPFFKVGSMQMAIRYDEDKMPQVPTKIFEINHSSGLIEFFLVADSGTRNRGQIYAINPATKQLVSSIVFFNNGNTVKRPIVYPKKWLFLGISFPDFLSFANTAGALRVTSPLRVDSVSFYLTTLADDEERFGFRQWFSVRNRLGEDIDWGYWAGKELVGDEVIDIPGEGFTWQEVLFLSAILREEIDAANIYESFTGTSRIIAEHSNYLTAQDYEYKVFQSVVWNKNIVSAV